MCRVRVSLTALPLHMIRGMLEVQQVEVRWRGWPLRPAFPLLLRFHSTCLLLHSAVYEECQVSWVFGPNRFRSFAR